MNLNPIFLKELDQESVTTRKMLERVPGDKLGWQPHPKSMTLGQLASHVAELPTWADMALHTDGLDFQANPYEPMVPKDTRDILDYFESSLSTGRDALKGDDGSQLEKEWTLSAGGQVLDRRTKAEVIRMTLNQITHHRAQLGVYLRLLDIPIPGSYGPSADEH